MKPKTREDFAKFLDIWGCKYGVEVGVHKGDHAQTLLDNIELKKLYLVDCWSREVWPRNRNVNKIYDVVCMRFKDDERVSIKKTWSTLAAEEYDNDCCDFVYLDACHTFECVMSDILSWLRCVRKGGIICGHDFCNKGKNYRVEEAVRTFFGAERIHVIPVAGEDPTWWVIK